MTASTITNILIGLLVLGFVLYPAGPRNAGAPRPSAPSW